MKSRELDYVELEDVLTEQRNPETVDIDKKGVLEILELINSEDMKVPQAVKLEIPNIAGAVELVVEGLRAGGRLIFVGAGTSGRLGVMEAAECPPTFGTPPRLIQAIVAGGRRAFWRSIDGAEDDEEDGRRAIRDKGVSPKDVVIGLSASGRTPFTLAALLEAKRRGARTIAVSVTPNPEIGRLSDILINPIVGPEVIAGSTRMKAGTAEKLVLNMISTAAMIRLGKVYSNLMVELKPGSEKLRARARRIIRILTGVDCETAREVFERSGRDLKTSLVMIEAKVGERAAKRALRESSGNVREALEKLSMRR
jgi:N-acetylmuramic acid 6-phosphate etherase